MILAGGMIEPTWQVAVFVAFRVASALPTLRWPLAGALIALVADFADLFLMDAIGGISDYQRLDKLCDLAYIAAFVIVTLRWSGLERVIALVLFVYALWPAKKAAGEEEAADVVVSVRVAQAERGTISAEVTALGTIFGREQATVSPKLSAQIKSMPLIRNRRVKAGEVIATLEVRDVQAQRAEAAAALDEALANLRLLSGGTIPEATAQDEKAVRDARANVNNARATYERRLQLFERGGISKKDLEASQLSLTTAENDLRAAEAAARLHQTASNPNNRSASASRVKQAQDRLAALDTQLSYAVIRAPFAGSWPTTPRAPRFRKGSNRR